MISDIRAFRGHPPLTRFGRQGEIQPLRFPEAERTAIEDMGNQAIGF